MPVTGGILYRRGKNNIWIEVGIRVCTSMCLLRFIQVFVYILLFLCPVFTDGGEICGVSYARGRIGGGGK